MAVFHTFFTFNRITSPLRINSVKQLFQFHLCNAHPPSLVYCVATRVPSGTNKRTNKQTNNQINETNVTSTTECSLKPENFCILKRLDKGSQEIDALNNNNNNIVSMHACGNDESFANKTFFKNMNRNFDYAHVMLCSCKRTNKQVNTHTHAHLAKRENDCVFFLSHSLSVYLLAFVYFLRTAQEKKGNRITDQLLV